MLGQISLTKVLFIDIETVSGAPDLSDLSQYEQKLWEEKRGKLRPKDIDEDEFYFNNAGILAEFGKIVCISMGYFVKQDNQLMFRIKSVVNDDEEQLLKDFVSLLEKFEKNFGNQLMICGHNVKEFDIPYICRRLLIHGMLEEFPDFFEKMQSAKPWELSSMVLDTLDVWRFGDYKNYISLKLLTHVLGLPSPKDDIDGSEVGRVYYHEHGLERIRIYCEKDVLAVGKIVSKLKGYPDIPDENIVPA